MKNLKELQKAHQELMTQYVDVLNKTSKLPFFIDAISLKQMEWNESSRHSFWLILYSILLVPFKLPFTLLTWRPLVRLFIEAHIHSKLKEISKSYIRLLQTIDITKKVNIRKTEWVAQSSANCDAFASTLFSWSSMKGGFLWLLNIAIGLILAWVGFDNIFQFAIKFDWARNIASVFITIAAVLIISVTYGFLVFCRRDGVFPNKTHIVISKCRFKAIS